MQTHEFLAGEYSIADIANWSWVSLYDWAGVSIEGLPGLQRWLNDIGERPAVKIGKDIPEPIVLEEENEEEVVDAIRNFVTE